MCAHIRSYATGVGERVVESPRPSETRLSTSFRETSRSTRILRSRLILRYASDREPGRAATLDVPIGGPTEPGPVHDVLLTVSVAGNTITQQFPAPSGQSTTTFTWDRKDAYGRLTQGLQPAIITVANEYVVTYQPTQAFGYYGGHAPLPGDPGRQLVSIPTTSATLLGG